VFSCHQVCGVAFGARVNGIHEVRVRSLCPQKLPSSGHATR
jgi:hypothetical protein